VSYNEVSGRYVSFKDREFYIPDHLRTQKGKPGNYHFEELEDESLYKSFVAWLERMDAAFREGYQLFEDSGIAKEQIRLPIPFHFYTEMIFTCNVHSLMHFLTLRLGPNAMWEIRQYGLALAEFFAESFPEAWAAFKEHRLSNTMSIDEWENLP
jgi:thymidylate synthase (FAD)